MPSNVSDHRGENPAPPDQTQVQAMLFFDVMHHLYDSGTVQSKGDRTIHTILDNFFGGQSSQKQPPGQEAPVNPRGVHGSPESHSWKPSESYDPRNPPPTTQKLLPPSSYTDQKRAAIPRHTAPESNSASVYGMPPIPGSIQAFASLPPPPPHQPLPPMEILKGDLVIYEYIAQRARFVADQLDASIAAIRTASSAMQNHGRPEAASYPPSSREYQANSYPPNPNNKERQANFYLPSTNSKEPPNMTAVRPAHHPQTSIPHVGTKRMVPSPPIVPSPPVVPDCDERSVDSDSTLEIANSMMERIQGPSKLSPPPPHRPIRPIPQLVPPTMPPYMKPAAPTYPPQGHRPPLILPALPEVPPVDPNRAREIERIKQEARMIALASTTSSSRSTGPPKKKTTEALALEFKLVPPPVLAPPDPETDYILRPGDSRENAESFTAADFVKWADVLAGNDWVTTDDIGCTMDAVLLSIAQFKVCALTSDDRIGRYMQQEIGYIGMCCKHCFGQPGYGRYFPSTLPSFVSSFPGTAVKHIAEDCSSCPKWIKSVVSETERLGQKSPMRQSLRHGSKGLFQKVWDALRSTKMEDIPMYDDEKKSRALQSIVSELSPESTWGDLLKGSELVHIEDQHLVPDQLYASFAQYEKCEADTDDCARPGRFKSPKEGFIGMRCRHCREEGYTPGSRLFPVNVLGLSLTDNCTKITKHILSICPQCPANIRTAIGTLEAHETSVTRRYGSRKIFFRRVWGRLHGDDPDNSADALSFDPVSNPADLDVLEDDEEDDVLPIEKLIDGSPLVTMEEHGMVSDAHFVAVAQLVPCRMELADKAGWYKDREIGFPGVCCKHCHGKPSSGRYFPRTGDNFLRSSRHSIIRHLTEICPSCPPDVRKSLVRLQQRDMLRSSWKIVDDSVLGSGKSFHEKLWVRLYAILNVPAGYYEALDYSNNSNAQNMTRYANVGMPVLGHNGRNTGIKITYHPPPPFVLPPSSKRRKNHEFGRGSQAKKKKSDSVPYPGNTH